MTFNEFLRLITNKIIKSKNYFTNAEKVCII